MRINEKHLTAFATGTAPMDREGFLYKRGEVNKSFHKRWFVLKGNLLFYYEKKTDKEPIGVIVLEGCTVELSEVNDTFAFELVFEGSGSRTYVLSADTQKDMENWMKAIACAGYDYMKLMVAELQRQMDDITVDKTPLSAGGSPQVSRTEIAEASGVDNTAQLLVDLANPASSEVPPPIPPRQPSSHASRRNPFNMAEMDLFGSASFDSSSRSNHRSRSFMDMHKEFGSYINKKMAECTSSNDLMS